MGGTKMGHFYWEWLRLSFSMPFAIAEIIGFIATILFGIIVWKRPIWEGKLKNLPWQIPLVVLIGGFVVGAIVAPYNIYKDKQNEASNLQIEFEQYREQHRPTLVLDTDNIKVNDNKEEQLVVISMDFIVKNIGDRPAYQTRFRLCAAPAKVPNEIDSISDVNDTNPLYEGLPLRAPFEYTMNYIIQNDKPIVISNALFIYIDLKYSDAANGGNWYEQPFWLAFDLNRQILGSLLPQYKSIFEPLVNKYYGNETQQ
jgi:hypothetical protein